MRTGSRNNPAYDAARDLDYCDSQLAAIFLCAGLPIDASDSHTIDEMVDAIRSIYPWIPTEQNIACYGLLMESHSFLLQNLRSLWHRRQLALKALQ